MSDMETTAEERTRWARHDPDPDLGGWLGKLTRDLDRAIARIADLEGEVAGVRATLSRALINLTHEVGFREEADARIAELEAEIARLTAELATMEEAAMRNGVALQREAREELAGLIPILMPIPASQAFRDGWVAGVKAYREAVRESVFREAKP